MSSLVFVRFSDCPNVNAPTTKPSSELHSTATYANFGEPVNAVQRGKLVGVDFSCLVENKISIGFLQHGQKVLAVDTATSLETFSFTAN